MSSIPPPHTPPSLHRTPSRKRARTMPRRASQTPSSSGAEHQALLKAIGKPSILIDGAQGEGGGQVIRVSLALAALFERSIQLYNIRAGRYPPGLQAQHMESVKVIGQISGAVQAGIGVGSRSVWMGVGKGYQGEGGGCVEGVVKTAGAVSLVLQAALPVALRYLGEGEILKLTGGTTAAFAPPSDYVRMVLVPNLRLFGIDLNFEVDVDGFYPRGGGKVRVSVSKEGCVDGCLRNVELLSGGPVLAIGGDVLVCGKEYVEKGVVEALCVGAVKMLRNSVEVETKLFPSMVKKHINVRDVSGENTSGKCISLTLHARTSKGLVWGATALWTERTAMRKCIEHTPFRMPRTDKEKWAMWRRTAESMGEEAVEEILEVYRSGAAVDQHMADQLIVFMAMAKGRSVCALPKSTSHVRSVLTVCTKFGVEAHVQNWNNRYSLTVEGKGIKVVNNDE